MSRSFCVPGFPLIEKKGESHWSERIKLVPPGKAMRWRGFPPPKS